MRKPKRHGFKDQIKGKEPIFCNALKELLQSGAVELGCGNHENYLTNDFEDVDEVNAAIAKAQDAVGNRGRGRTGGCRGQSTQSGSRYGGGAHRVHYKKEADYVAGVYDALVNGQAGAIPNAV